MISCRTLFSAIPCGFTSLVALKSGADVRRGCCLQAAVSQRCRDVIRHAEQRKAYKGTLTILTIPGELEAQQTEAEMMDIADRQQGAKRRHKR